MPRDLQSIAKELEIDFPTQVRLWHSRNKSTYAKTARHFGIEPMKARKYCQPLEVDGPEIALARAEFERTFAGRREDAIGMRRSLKGTYVNPSRARDWRLFKMGVEYALKQKAESYE